MLIVGYDPGEYTGLAIFDLRGRLLFKITKKDFSEEEIIKEITKFGKPIFIATDKEKIPKSVEKLAMRVKAKVFNPKEDLPVKKKIELARKFNPRDDHERDAIAAAYFAYLSYQKLIEKIEEKLRALTLDYVFERVIREEISIANVLEDSLFGEKETTETVEIVEGKERMNDERSNKKLKKEIERLRKLISFYEKRLEALTEENIRLRKLISELSRPIKIEINLNFAENESSSNIEEINEIKVNKIVEDYRRSRLKEFFE